MKKLLPLSLFLLAAACAHAPSAPAPAWNWPPSQAASSSTLVNSPQSAAMADVAVSSDTAPTEENISALEEGEEAGNEVFISSAPPEPPAPVNLGGNGSLTLTRRDTGERLTVTYRLKNGEYDEDALAKINRIMRCSLDGAEKEMAVKLVELLDAVEDRFGKRGLVLLSGYRSYKLNHITPGAAEHSLHMLGWAADIKIPGYSSTKVRNYARKLGIGGVGYYPLMGFTHLDVGKVRYWAVTRKPRRRRAAHKAPRKAAAAKKAAHRRAAR